MVDIGSRIIKLRKSFGISQRQLASLSGVSQSGLSFIEANEKSPSLETLSLICKALNISLSEILSEVETDNGKNLFELQQLLMEAKQLPLDKIKLLISIAKAMQ